MIKSGSFLFLEENEGTELWNRRRDEEEEEEKSFMAAI